MEYPSEPYFPCQVPSEARSVFTKFATAGLADEEGLALSSPASSNSAKVKREEARRTGVFRLILVCFLYESMHGAYSPSMVSNYCTKGPSKARHKTMTLRQ